MYQTACATVPMYFDKYRSGILKQCYTFLYLMHCSPMVISKLLQLFFISYIYFTVALGFVSAASAVGQFVYPFIIPPLVAHFAWRGSMLILSRILLHVCIAAMVLRPDSQVRLKKTKKNVECENEENAVITKPNKR